MSGDCNSLHWHYIDYSTGDNHIYWWIHFYLNLLFEMHRGKTRPIHRFFKWKCAKHGIVLIIMCTGENKYQIKYNFSRVNSVYTEKKRVVQREDNQKFPDAYYEKWDGCSPNVILCKQLINSFVTHCIVCCVYIFFGRLLSNFSRYE